MPTRPLPVTVRVTVGRPYGSEFVSRAQELSFALPRDVRDVAADDQLNFRNDVAEVAAKAAREAVEMFFMANSD